jgi:hypothetical protein
MRRLVEARLHRREDHAPRVTPIESGDLPADGKIVSLELLRPARVED